MTRSLPKLVLVVLLSAPLLAAEPVPAEKRFPRTTVAFISVRNVPELSRKFSESNTGRLVSDPALAELRKGLLDRIGEQAKEFEDRAGLTVADLLGLPQGEASVGLMTVKGKLSLVGVLDYGKNEDQVKKLLVTATDVIVKSARQSEEEFEGSQLVVFRFGDDSPEARRRQSASPTSGFNSVVWCLKDDHLILGSSPDAVKSVLRFWRGEQPDSLADTEVYKGIAQTCRGAESDPEIKWFVNPIGIANAAAAQLGVAGLAVTGTIITTGLDKFRGVGGSVDFSQGDFDYVARVLFAMDRPRTGVLNVFDFPAADLTPPAWVPADAMNYQALSWDVEKAYATVEKTYDQVQGKGKFAKFLEDQAAANESAGIHYKRDIVDHLTGRAQLVLLPAKADMDGKLGTAPTLAVVDVKDQAVFEKSLAKVTGHPDFPGKKRDFEGTTIYQSEPGRPPFALAVRQEKVYVATDAVLLETALKGSAPPLAESAAWKAVSRHFPKEASYVSFSRSDAQLRTYLEMLKAAQGQGENPPALPSVESLQKYFTPGGTYLVPDDCGLFLVTFSLKAKPE